MSERNSKWDELQWPNGRDYPRRSRLVVKEGTTWWITCTGHKAFWSETIPNHPGFGQIERSYGWCRAKFFRGLCVVAIRPTDRKNFECNSQRLYQIFCQNRPVGCLPLCKNPCFNQPIVLYYLHRREWIFTSRGLLCRLQYKTQDKWSQVCNNNI